MTTSEPTSPKTEPSSVGSWTTIRTVLVAVVVCEGVGALAGWATQTSVDTWYPTLTKPWFTPPDWLFAPAWITLYAMMGVAVAYVWMNRTAGRSTRRWALGAFGVQLALNLAWSIVFFGGQSIGGGLLVITALWGAIAWTIERFARVHTVAAGLLVPYLLWVTYAAALNVGLAILN